MKNIILDNIIFSLQKHGGVSVLWSELIKALQTSNVNFKCIEYKDCFNNKVRTNLTINNSNLITYNSSLIKLRRYSDIRINTPCKFIFHSSHYRICLSKLAKNITTVHDFTYEYYRRGLAKKIHCWQKYKAINHSDIIVCISENTKKDLLQFLPQITKKKIITIYNGVSKDYHPLNTLPNDYSDYILYVGGRQTYKNFDFAIDAVAAIKGKIIICGGPLTDQEIKRLNLKLGINNYIHILHPSNEKLNEIYNSVKYLLYPSSYEGFGIPVIEAERAGCPVIAMNTSSIPEIIGNTPLLLSTTSIKEFIEKDTIVSNSKTRNEIIDMGFKNSIRFSWENMTNNYLDLYRNII